MAENDKAILVYTTFPSVEAAEEAGGALVDASLAACVNIVPGMTSLYMWRGKRERSQEAVMIVKTRAALADAVIAEVRRRHPYDNPAILVLPVVGGAAAFLDWIIAGTRAKDAAP